MSFPEAIFTIGEVLSGVKRNQITGVPPKNISAKVTPSDSSIYITFNPEDTIIERQLICTMSGVLIRIKQDSAPADINDGDFVGDFHGIHLRDHVSDPLIISGLTNETDYYVRLFPYSDHGVYNFNEANIYLIGPSAVKIFGFRQNMTDKNPATTITYLEDAIDFAPMHTNSSTGAITDGSWGTWDWLQKNLPYMVKRDGTIDYQLDPNDYTKRLDGEPSDIANTLYNGGAFSWLPKLYMKEVYSADGERRDVYFATSNRVAKTADFKPVGFVDPNNAELDGLWLPMFYMDANGKTLSGTTPVASRTTEQEKLIIDSFSTRGVFLGGPILNVLRDVMYMLYRSTNIQEKGGHGRSGASGTSVPVNAIVGGGRFYGTGTAANLRNKAFHSSVLFSYNQWLRDPYTLLILGQLHVSPNYKYSLTGVDYIKPGITWVVASGWFPSHVQYLGAGVGSFPKCENTGSSSLGLCDGIYSVITLTRVALRLGRSGVGLLAGPSAVDLNDEASVADWSCGVGLVLLPPAGYAPA